MRRAASSGLLLCVVLVCVVVLVVLVCVVVLVVLVPVVVLVVLVCVVVVVVLDERVGDDEQRRAADRPEVRLLRSRPS